MDVGSKLFLLYCEKITEIIQRGIGNELEKKSSDFLRCSEGRVAN